MRRRAAAVAIGLVAAGAGTAVALSVTGGPARHAPSPPVDATAGPNASTPPPPTKPPLPPRTVVHVPWVDTPYDAARPPAFPGSVPDPHVPWCRASDLTITTDWQGATGNLFGAATVTNTSARTCALQGQPSVAIVDSDGRDVVAADADPFYVEQWVRLTSNASATSEIDWYGEFCHRPQPHALLLTLPHRGGHLRARMQEAPPCQADSDAPSAGLLQLHGFVRRTAHHLATRFTPEADLDASVGHVQRHVVAGNTLHYRVRLFSLGRGQVQLRPCLPYRERLLSTSGAVVVTQAFRLNCNPVFSQPDTPQSGYVNYYAMRLQVPSSLPPGRYALQWQSALEPVQDTAAARVVVTQ